MGSRGATASLANEAHSGLAWVTMGALGERTRSAWIGTTVTCPTLRYHPAVVAEGFASLSLPYPSRVFLGVGSSEALNIDKIEELFKSGATIVNIHSGQDNQKRVIDFYGSSVLPKISKLH